MKTLLKVLLFTISAIGLFYIVIAFSFKDPDPSCFHENIPPKPIVIEELPAANDYAGVFKSNVAINYKKWDSKTKNFSGLKIEVEGNPKIDEIFVGLTNNRNCRLELWNNKQLISIQEKGFSSKIEWPEPFNLSMEFFDQSNLRYSGEASLKFRVYQGSHFLGSAGEMNIDLTQYGDFSQAKKLSTFSLDLDDRSTVEEVSFSALKVWKNHKSAD